MLKGSDDIYVLILLGMAGTFMLCGAIILFYIKYQKKLHQHRQMMKDAEMQYQVQILQKTIQSQEDERRRIGRDLHDEVGASLASLRLLVSRLVKTDTPDDIAADVKYCQGIADNVIDTVRSISHNLSPSGLELFGFTDTLADLCERVSKSSGLVVKFSNQDALTAEPDLNTAIALYRVMQELMTNTMKHAGAEQINITLASDGGNLVLEYSDDGKGMAMDTGPSRGIGLQNIESRLSMVNARYAIGLKEEKGFNIHIEVPLKR